MTVSMSYLAKLASNVWVDAREVLTVVEGRHSITQAVTTLVTLRNGRVFEIAAPAARVVAKIDAAFLGRT